MDTYHPSLDSIFEMLHNINRNSVHHVVHLSKNMMDMYFNWKAKSNLGVMEKQMSL